MQDIFALLGGRPVELRYRERKLSISDPDLPGKMTVSLIVDDRTADRLQEAFYEALARKALHPPTYAAAEDGPAETTRWCLCVAPEIGRRIRLQGWRDGLIFVVTQEEFERRRPLLGPRDALLFHDVTPARLRVAVRLAISGMTLFPSELVPEGKMAGPVLEGFEQLSDTDRAVIAELAFGTRNQKIANRLGLSPRSVGESVDRIFRTLGCLNRTEVALLAYGRFSPFLELRESQPKSARPMSGGI